MKNSIEEDITLIEKSLCDKDTIIQYHYWVGTDFLNAVERIVADYKIVLKENEQLRTEVNSLKKENEGLKEYIAIAPNLDEMTAIKYRNIQQEAYIQGRAEEQKKAGQIIYENYIPIQKVKDKIEELKKKVEELTDEKGYWGGSDLLEQIKVLQVLLEKEK
jgi:hypothetical protein